MKRILRWTGMFFIALVLCIGASSVFSSATSITAEAAVSDGWHGKRYYQNGEYLTGMKKVDGKYYYFGKNGKYKTKYWYTSSKGKKYYFNSKGVRTSGIKKIKGKYYYFKDNGVQLTKDKTIGKYKYYVSVNGYLEGYTKKSSGKTKYYNPNGKKMTSKQKSEFLTLQNAKKVVKKVTKSSMSKSKKLKACFDWVVSKYYKLHTHYTSTWYCDYANDHFEKGCGDCRADGSAFAFLAKELGYTKVYICADSTAIPKSGHCWCEINGKVYDPLFAEVYGYSKYYGGTYASAGLYRATAVKIA